MKPILLASILMVSAMFGASEIVPLPEWKFTKLDRSPGGKGETITLPHTWNSGDSTRKDFYRGPAVYWRDLGPGKAFGGKRVFLRCEAVSTVAEIILNGRLVGRHVGGFTAFGFELTGFLDPEKANTLEIRANNEWRADVIPLDMDFSIAGGAYRPVSLVVCDEVCLNPVLDGARGLTLAYGAATTEKAEVAATATVSNGGKSPVPVKVRFSLLDAQGAEAASVVKDASAAPGDNKITADLAVERPRLWNGVQDPYLYTTRVTVETGGAETDRREIPTGFRDIRIDAEKGLFLNGAHLRLNGVNRHQDWETVGWALTPEQHRTDARMIRELGANAVRGSHYPHSADFLDECDRLGLLVWAEIPFANSVGSPAQHPDLEPHTLAQLHEMIRQQGHHPAIFCWSLYNELGMSSSVDYVPMLRVLNEAAHREDPSRPTVGATFHARKDLCQVTDLIAFNNYPGWYYDAPDAMEKFIRKYRETAPGKPWGVSEYGAGASVKHHDPFVSQRIKAGADWHPEEWQCRVHEGNYATFQQHPELWGTFLWTMFDFASIGKNEGDRHGINDKGLVTRDRKVRKDAWYFYHANWSGEPVLHLLSKRATPLKTATFPIRLYSNLPDIRVTANGRDLGSPRKFAPMAYEFDPVQTPPGKLTVTATARAADGREVTDTAEWDITAP